MKVFGLGQVLALDAFDRADRLRHLPIDDAAPVRRAQALARCARPASALGRQVLLVGLPALAEAAAALRALRRLVQARPPQLLVEMAPHAVSQAERLREPVSHRVDFPKEGGGDERLW